MYALFVWLLIQVRTLIRKDFKAALEQNDILISPAAPSAAYKIGEKKDDPLAMYAGDIMTVKIFRSFFLYLIVVTRNIVCIIWGLLQVNVNLAGLPAMVLPCGLVEGGPSGLPVGLQMIGAAFDEVCYKLCLFAYSKRLD